MSDKRKHVRHDCDFEVEIAVGEDIRPGRAVNISRGGIFVRTDPVPDFGARVQLRMQLQGVRERSEIPCVVRWRKPGEGIGLQFETLRAIEAWALNKLLRDQS
ncbi:MAG: PilZ domain-containing protein [Polyangia bacterium]